MKTDWRYFRNVALWLSIWYVCSLINLLMNKILLSERGCSPIGVGIVQTSVTALFGGIKVLGPGLMSHFRTSKKAKDALKRKVSDLNYYDNGDLESPSTAGGTKSGKVEKYGKSSKNQGEAGSYSVQDLMGKPDFWRKMLVLGALRGATVVLGLISLSYVAVSFTETIKASAPLATVLFAWFILGEKTSVPVLLSLFPVMGGLTLCTATELSFHMIGFLAAMSNNFLDCIQNVFSKQMMKLGLVTPVQLQFFTSLVGGFFQLPVMLWQLRGAPATNTIQAATSTSPGTDEGSHLTTIYVLTCAVFFHFQSVSAYYTMSLLAPVTQSVANTLKRTLLIFLSILYFGNTVLPSTILGIIMVVGGVGLYNYLNSMATQRNERGSKASKDLNRS